MNTRALAKRALRHLSTLNMDHKDYPCDSSYFFVRNEKDYQALKELNDAGLGATVEELILLAGEPTEGQLKSVVARIKKIDEHFNKIKGSK